MRIRGVGAPSTNRLHCSVCSIAEPLVRAVNHVGRPVPSQDVPAPAEHVGGLPSETFQHPAKRFIDPLRPRGPPLRPRPVMQDEQVAPFGWIEPQRSSERRENLIRRTHVPSLFQPSVPSGSDPREHRHLLAAQARRSSPEALRQPDGGRGQALPARAQEFASLTSAGGRVGGCKVAHGVRIVRSILGSTKDCEAFISFDQDFRESCQRPWRHQGADALATGAQRAHIWKVVFFEGLDSHGRRNDKEGQASPRPNASRATAR